MKKASFSLDDIIGTKKGQGLREDAAPDESPDENIQESENADELEDGSEFEGIDEIMQESNEADAELSEEIKSEGESETSNINNGNSIDSEPEIIDINLGGKTAGQVVQDALNEKMKAYKVFISGRLLLVMCDAVFPRVIFGGAKMFGYKSDKTSWRDIVLTEEQITELEPIADQIVDYIFSNVHPLAQFSMALGASYAENL